MKLRNLASKVLVVAISATSIMGGSLTAFAATDTYTPVAPTNTTGDVYVDVEKTAAYNTSASTSDINYVIAPTKVALSDVASAMYVGGVYDTLTPNDGISNITILDVLKYVGGTSIDFNATYYSSYSSYYVSAISDPSYVAAKYVDSTGNFTFANQISSLSSQYGLNTVFNGTIASTGNLTQNDLISNGASGWMIAQNNVGPYYGVSTEVAANDTMRMEWTTFNGMDVGYTGYLGANWTAVDPFIYNTVNGVKVKVDKDALVDWLAVPANVTNYPNKASLANNTLKDLDATQDDVDEVVDSF